jgi:hypothetical protein
MKYISHALGVAAVAAILLTGCTAGTEPTTDATPTSSAPVATSTSAATAHPAMGTVQATTDARGASGSAPSGQAWADEKVSQWWDAEGAEDFSEFYHPFNLVESWESPAQGELEITVDPAITDTDHTYLNDQGPANDVWMIAAVMWDQLDREDNAADLESITVRTADGERTEVFTREDKYGPQASGEHDPSSQEWADEMVDLWLEAEGVQSVKGLLDPFNLIQSWEATGPGELTLYADPAILDDPTHTEDGPGVLYGITALVWQRLYCGAPELESVTVATTDGQESHTTPRSEWSPSRQVYGDTCQS